jgi:hypothetical protein
MKAIKSGIGIAEDSFVFSLSPAGVEVRTIDDGRRMSVVKNAIPGKTEEAEIRDDVVTYRPQCLDVGVWEIGGSAVLLRIVELADVSLIEYLSYTSLTIGDYFRTRTISVMPFPSLSILYALVGETQKMWSVYVNSRSFSFLFDATD